MGRTSSPLAIRGEIVHFNADPLDRGADAIEHFDDGLLLIADGRIDACAPAQALLPNLPASARLFDYRGKLILPGFIDTHVHYPQTGMIASYGEQLPTWLEKYTFPAESSFADAAHASAEAEFFCDQLLAHGTTTAMVLATVHPVSVDALFKAARARRMRLIAGKVLMDRNCPDELREDADAGDAASRTLIEKWHGRSRLAYAVTPRFAPTSSDAQMRLAGRLFASYPGLYLQSHAAEHREEVAWASKLFPAARSYLAIYDEHRQLGARSVYAHCIWIDDEDRRLMAARGAAISFCPTSNLFLGSGLFDLAAAVRHGLRVGLGTDVGAGTSLSLLQTLNEAYKVLQLSGQSLSAERAFYLATLGGARSLYLDGEIGSFAVGREADFVVLDPLATPLLAHRMARARTLAERLFVLMMLGDDRCVAATHILGEAAFVAVRPG